MDVMTFPTPEAMQLLPINHKNAESLRVVIIGAITPAFALAILSVAARFYGKGIIQKALGLDDWIMLLAMIIALPVSGMAIAALSFGIGRRVWDQKVEWALPRNKLGYASNIAFPLACALTKVSVCLTYLRLFRLRSDKIFCYTLTVFVGVHSFISLMLSIFLCKPIQSYWDFSTPKNCIDMRSVFLFGAAMNTLSDFIVYLWPAVPLWSLQVPTRQRLGLILLFAAGCIVCAGGIIRVYYLIRYFSTVDPFWDAAIIYTTMTYEVNLGIICGCLSGIKPVLRFLFPRFFHNPTTHTARTFSLNTSRTARSRSKSLASRIHSSSNISNSRIINIHVPSPEPFNLADIERRDRVWASSSVELEDIDQIPSHAIVVNHVITISEEGDAGEQTLEMRAVVPEGEWFAKRNGTGVCAGDFSRKE